MEKKRMHLLTIQALIRRMMVGSVLSRVWSILIVSALLVVTANPVHARFAWLAMFLTILFWMLDAYFLRQGRLFRKFYARVENQRESQVDFRLDTSPVDTEADAFRSVLFSKTPAMFFGGVIALLGVARLILDRR